MNLDFIFCKHLVLTQSESTTRAKQPNLLTKHFTRKSISREAHIFSPVNC